MAWTTPRTWVTSEVVTASIMNTHIRDNFNETGPAKITAASSILVSTGANTLAERTPLQAFDGAQVTSASTSYVNLAPSVAVTTTTSTKAIVGWSANMWNGTAGAETWLSFSIEGATTASASDSIAVMATSNAANDAYRIGNVQLYQGLTAGSNTFRLVCRVSAGSGQWDDRRILVVPL